MSMLAERKQKQRLSLNPRGKDWSEDVNKFGHKMLERMGWTTGKGLGANEDGITEHVKVSHKSDSKGIGFKDNSEHWTKHEDKFMSLLTNLGSGNLSHSITLPSPEKSLEKKSQSSKARVHYHKLMRGKDLTSRSEKDIANIFGRKTLMRNEEVQESEEDSKNETEDKSYGVVTIKAGNMNDYFKFKLSKLGQLYSNVNCALNEQEDNESEVGACTGFGFSSGSDNDKKDKNSGSPFGINKKFISAQSSPAAEIDRNMKKRKRIESEDVQEVGNKKKKKNKKSQLAFDNLGSEINTADELCFKEIDSPGIKQNVKKDTKKIKHVTFSTSANKILNKSDESTTGSLKKKMKKKNVTSGIDNLACEENSFEKSNQLSNETTSISKKKKRCGSDNNEISINKSPIKNKKKKKNEEQGIDNLACEEISVNEKNEEIKRYKLKKKAMKHGLVNPACVANDYSLKDNSIAEQSQSKNKRKVKNLSYEDDSSDETLTEYMELLLQKIIRDKSKKKSFEINDEIVVNVPQNIKKDKTQKLKKKKKVEGTKKISQLGSPSKKLKKKIKSKGAGIENLGCEINTIEENIASINSEIDNYETELENDMNVKKAKKQQKTNAIKKPLNKNKLNKVIKQNSNIKKKIKSTSDSSVNTISKKAVSKKTISKSPIIQSNKPQEQFQNKNIEGQTESFSNQSDDKPLNKPNEPNPLQQRNFGGNDNVFPNQFNNMPFDNRNVLNEFLMSFFNNQNGPYQSNFSGGNEGFNPFQFQNRNIPGTNQGCIPNQFQNMNFTGRNPGFIPNQFQNRNFTGSNEGFIPNQFQNKNFSGSNQRFIPNRFQNRNFSGRNERFIPNQFNNRPFVNRFQNRSFDNNSRPNQFQNRSFDNQSRPNRFQNRSFDNQSRPNQFQNRSFGNQSRPNQFHNNTFNNGNRRSFPPKVDKKSIKHIVKPGELKLNFSGSNLNKLVGYGVAPELSTKVTSGPSTKDNKYKTDLL